MIKLRKITWMIHVAHMAMKCTQNFGRKISGKKSLGRSSCRQHKVKHIIKKYYVRLWSGFMWFTKGKVVDFLNMRMYCLVSLKVGNFLITD